LRLVRKKVFTTCRTKLQAFENCKRYKIPSIRKIYKITSLLILFCQSTFKIMHFYLLNNSLSLSPDKGVENSLLNESKIQTWKEKKKTSTLPPLSQNTNTHTRTHAYTHNTHTHTQTHPHTHTLTQTIA
jgi:hypothetical protein